MGEVTTVGLDIAKSVFQVHGIERRRTKSNPTVFCHRAREPSQIVSSGWACRTSPVREQATRQWSDRGAFVPVYVNVRYWSANDVVDGSPPTCGIQRGLSRKESHDG